MTAYEFPSVEKKTVDLIADSNAKPFGCRILTGGLFPALSCTDKGGSVPADLIWSGYSEGTKKFFICDKNFAYVSEDGLIFAATELIEGENPFLAEEIADGRTDAVIIKGSKALAFNDGDTEAEAYEYGANLSCGIMHCGRLFGADAENGRRLRWSGEGGVGDWTDGLYGGGYVDLDPKYGDILDIKEFGENLVLVRKYGLTVVKANGNPENFAVRLTDTQTDVIYKDSAAVVGATMLFYTASGLCGYDGSEIKRVKHRFTGDLSGPKCSAAYAGQYFLSCRSEILGGGAILCYDPRDGESYLIGVAADGLCSADGVYAYNTSVNKLEEGADYVLLCPNINFGSGRRKTVTEIFVDCGDADGVDVEVDNGEFTRKFSGVKGRVRVGLRGKSFTFRIYGNCPLHALTATAEASVGI